MFLSKPLIIIWGVVAAALIALTLWFAQARIVEIQKRAVGQSLQTVLETTHQAVLSWQEKHLAFSAYWSQQPQLIRLTQQLRTLPPHSDSLMLSPLQAELRQLTDSAIKTRDMRGFLIVDLNNIVLASSNTDYFGNSEFLSQQQTFVQRLHDGEVAMSKPQLSEVPLLDALGKLHSGLPTMFVGAPIRDEQGAVIAVLLFRIDPGADFTTIFQHGRIGASGETYAIDRQGYLISESRFDEHVSQAHLIQYGERAALNIRIADPGANLHEGEKSQKPISSWPLTLMANSATAGASDMDLEGYRDYRGVPVVGAWLWDTKLNFGITTEIDVAQAYEGIRKVELFSRIASLVMVAVIIGLIGIYLWSYRQITLREQRFSLALQANSDGFWDWELESDLVYYSPSWASLLGYDADDVDSNIRSWRRLVHSEDRRFMEQHFDHLIAGDENEGDKKYRLLTNDGSYITVVSRSIVVKSDLTGKVERIISAETDISEQLALSRAADQQTQKYQLLADNLGKYHFFFSQSRDRTLQHISSRVESLLGYSPEEMIDLWSIMLSENEDDQTALSAVRKIHHGETPGPFDVQVRAKSGEMKFFQVTEYPLFDNTGQVVGSEGFAQDITERKRIDNVLHTIAEDVFQKSGPAFFQALACAVAKSLAVRWVLVAELQGQQQQQVSSLAVSSDGEIIENFEYLLADTLDSELVKQSATVIDRVTCQQQHSHGAWLVEQGIDHYIGSPLIDKNNQVIGILVLMDSQPILLSDELWSLLNIFTSQAATELQRERSLNALSISESRYRGLVDSAMDGIALITPEGDFVDVNETLCRMTGYSYEELLNLNLRDVAVDDVKRLQEDVDQVLAGHPEIKRWTGVRKDGSTFEVEVNPGVVNIKGEVLLIHNVRDISSRLVIERELMDNKWHLEKAEAIAQIGHWHWDSSTDRFIWSPGTYRILGIETGSASTSAEDFMTFVVSADRERVGEYREQFRLSSALSTSIEYRIQRADGAERIILGSSEKSFDDDGKLNSWLGVLRDITDLRQMEQALTQSEQRLVLAMQGSGDGLWDWDLETGQANFSDNWADVLGYSTVELGSALEDTLALLHPDDSERVEAFLRSSGDDQNQTFQIEYRMRHYDGHYIDVLFRGLGVRNVADNRITRIVGALTDITERKRELQQIAERLQFETLLSAISSDFIAIPVDQVSTAIEHALADLGTYMKVDRVTMTVLNVAQNAMLMSGEWCVEGVGKLLERAQDYRFEKLAKQVALQVMKEPIIINNADDLQDDQTTEHRMYEFSGSRSAVVMPLHFAGESVGFVSIAMVNEPRCWSNEILVQLKLMTEIISNAVARKMVDDQLMALTVKLQQENIYLKEEIKVERNFEEILGSSSKLKGVLRLVEQVEKTDTTILLLGESGTGKELVARALHSTGLRQDKALISINCAALTPTLLESELFGHQKGAFTGAVSNRAGRFELADGGTLFLDEIGEIALDLQAKLLRVLQEGEFERLGSDKTSKVDVRLIAATNRDLVAAIKRGEFREDLYYRLNVFPIELPPLRDRSDDIPMLVRFFVETYATAMGKELTDISPQSLSRLEHYQWPGNIRELKNVIERAVIISPGPTLLLDENFGKESGFDAAFIEPQSLEAVEHQHISTVLAQTGWKIEGPRGAAQILDINPATLRSRMKKLGIVKPDR